MEERIQTGIEGFDKLCKGGLVSNSINLVMGNAGAGKTTFLLQFLYNGATKFDENGLFVSFEQEVNDLYRTGNKMGLDFQSLEKEEKFIFLRIDEKMVVKQIQKKILDLVVKHDIKRVCLDPINVLSVNLPQGVSLRKQLFDLLVILKKIGTCVLIAGEADEQNDNFYALSDEITFTRYLVDGIIELFSSGLSGVGDRAIRISKMRMTEHVRGPVGMQITDKGIKILKN